MNVDHVVLWVDSAKKSLEFYVGVVGLQPVRQREFEQGTAPFPSVRVSETAILDIMEKRAAASVRDFTGGGSGAGQAINHICLAMGAEDYAALIARLEAGGVALSSGGERAFGAQGRAVKSTYFCDPDDNVIEIRYYDEEAGLDG